MTSLDATRTIVCVLGMHRSGTSLSMRLLNLLGIAVGPEEHLVPPAADNPKGFWEHRSIVEINKLLLRRHGGRCLRPPKFEPHWANNPRLDDLRTRAQRLLTEHFADYRSWGWKDPRSCLTLPFWHTVVAPTHYVLCVRHPCDVARSLERRDGVSLAFALRLWLVYTRSALRATRGENRLCISYECIVDGWRAQLSRLASFVGLSGRAVDAGVCDAVSRLVDPSLQHHRTHDAPHKMVENELTAAFQAATRAYEELAWRDAPRDDDVDRHLDDALALVTPIVEQEQTVAVASWNQRRRQGLDQITSAVPVGESFVLVDAMKWATEDWIDGRRRIPFLEHEGQYWGLPPDDETAIRELSRLCHGGVAFVAVAEPAFGWLDSYPGMIKWLRQTFRCIVETDRTVVFDLRRMGKDHR